MANIKSAKKRVLIAEKNRVRNVAFKTSIKTAVKKVLELAKGDDKEALTVYFENNELHHSILLINTLNSEIDSLEMQKQELVSFGRISDVASAKGYTYQNDATAALK